MSEPISHQPSLAEIPHTLGLIAGNGVYPQTVVEAARKAGVRRIVVAAFENETPPSLAGLVDKIEWLRVGQLGRMIKFLANEGVKQAMMAGQIAPKNLFDLRPDLRALLLLAKVRVRNAESLFGAIGHELEKDGITLLLATTFLEDLLAPSGHVCGPAPSKKQLPDIDYGFGIAKETSRLDIGQSVVVKKGTVLAVEAFEGTDECIKRGGQLGRGNGATLAKVSKPNQDLRFDVPVIGPKTIESCISAGVSTIVVEAGKTLLLEKPALFRLCADHKLTVFAK